MYVGRKVHWSDKLLLRPHYLRSLPKFSITWFYSGAIWLLSRFNQRSLTEVPGPGLVP